MKKLNVFACLFYGTVTAGCTYLGFFLGSIIHPGMTLYTFVPALKEQMANPLKIKVTAYTPYTMIAVFFTALLSVMVQCNAALCSRRKKHFNFDSINTITALSFC